MTPDLDEIRAALAVANRRDFANQALHEKNHLYENAPTWLAALVQEVERLRAECVELQGAADDTTDWQNYKQSESARENATAEIGRLQREIEMSHDDHTFVAAERDAALERCEKLEAELVDLREVFNANRHP